MLIGGKGKLRNKIIIWSFVPAVLIFALVTSVSLYAYQRVTENLVVERDRDLTRLSASVLAAQLAAYTDPRSDQFLSAFDSGMVVFDQGGKVLAADAEQLGKWGTSWAARVPFRLLSESKKPVFTDVVLDAPDGGKAVLVVVPVTGQDGKFLAGIAGVFVLRPSADSEFYRGIQSLARKECSCIYLVDANGRVIYHSKPDQIGQDFSTRDIVQRALGGQVGALRTRDPDGRSIVASFAPIPETPWSLVVEENWADLTATSRRYAQVLMLLLALGVIVPTLIVSVGVKRITGPVTELIGAAQKVAQGDFAQQITAETGDEVGELARQFSLMAARLQESYDQLEHQVADRTKELAALNALAAVVSRSLDLEEILRDALDQAMGIMGMEKGEAFVLDVETQGMISKARRGLSDDSVHLANQVLLAPDGDGVEVQPTARAIRDLAVGKTRELLEAEGVQTVISIPLVAKEKTVGTIELGAGGGRVLNSGELSLLTAIGHQVGVAVENARLYQQAQRLAVMEERNRLARDLHDSVMQALYGVTMYAEAAARQLAASETGTTSEHLHEIRSIAQDALQEMRLLIYELRPPVLARDGLAAALRSRLEAVESQLGIATVFDTDLVGRVRPEIEEGLYRIAQEALNNILKHAHARRVLVRLHQEEQTVTLEVQDNGVGFDPAVARQKGGLGLRGIEERVARLGGRLVLESAPGKGTRLTVEAYP